MGMTSAVVCRRARLTYRRLDYLVAERCIPDRRDYGGSGSRRFFQPVDLDVAAILGRMGEMGGAGRHAAGHDRGLGMWREAAALLYALDRPWPDGWLVCESGASPRVIDQVEMFVRLIDAAALVVRIPPDVRVA